jgi:hypothetical protein
MGEKFKYFSLLQLQTRGGTRWKDTRWKDTGGGILLYNREAVREQKVQQVILTLENFREIFLKKKFPRKFVV